MMHTLINGLNYGLIFAPLALGVFISYRLLRFVDMSVDGTFVLGGMLAAVLLRDAMDPFVATAAAFVAGAMAGAITGLVNTRLGVPRILAGILVMTALYSVNSFIIGAWWPSVHPQDSLLGLARGLAVAVYGSTDPYQFLDMTFFPEDVMSMFLYGLVTGISIALLQLFFHTRMGMAIRGAGGNAHAVRALGVNVPLVVTVALALSNGLAAVSGSLYAQEFESFDLKSGVGTIVLGLACVVIGQALSARRRFSLQLLSAVVGALLYQLLIALLVSDDHLSGNVKLYTAIIVLVAMLLPGWLRPGRSKAPVREE